MRFLAIGLLASIVPVWCQTIAGNTAQSGSNPPQAPTRSAVGKPAPATLSGQVLSRQGEPVRKAEVTLRRTDVRGGPNQGLRTTTDASGNFVVPDLDPGKYMLVVEKNGFVRQVYGASRPGRAGASMISLSAGQNLSGIVLKMTPQGVVTGKVHDEDGEAVSGVTVQALQQRYVQNRRQWFPVEESDVNDLGEYRLAGLAPGRYVIAVTPQRFRMATPAAKSDKPDENYVLTFYPGTPALEQAAPVEVASGVELRNTDLRLAKTRTYRVRGRVVDGTTGKPVTNARVMAAASDGPSFAFANGRAAGVRNAEGTFEITGLAPGTYSLSVYRMGTGGGAARQDVTIGERNVSDVILTVQPGFTAAGAVRTEGPNAVATDGMRVFLQPQAGMRFGGARGSVASDGTFKLENTTPGKYTVSVVPLTNAYVKSVRVANQTMPDLTADLTAGPSPIDILLSTAGATVQGTIQDSKKRPTEGVTVALVPDAALRGRADLYKHTVTGANGTFTFQAIPPGEYKLFAWEDIEDYAWMDPAVIGTFENQGKAVSLKEGASENVTMGFIAPEGGSQLEREADAPERSDESK